MLSNNIKRLFSLSVKKKSSLSRPMSSETDLQADRSRWLIRFQPFSFDFSFRYFQPGSKPTSQQQRGSIDDPYPIRDDTYYMIDTSAATLHDYCSFYTQILNTAVVYSNKDWLRRRTHDKTGRLQKSINTAAAVCTMNIGDYCCSLLFTIEHKKQQQAVVVLL